MPSKICVSITHAKNDLDKATVGFVVANASVASGQDTLVFLSIEGVRLSVKGFADGLHEEGFAPIQDLIQSFVKAGGRIFVCSPCMKKRGLDAQPLVDGATIVGGAKLVEFLAAGASCISY
jgi:predicted peroxiredoxin